MPTLASILDRLFGLTQVSWSDADTALGWRTPLPAWGWALIVLGAAAMAGWSYHRMLGKRGPRIALALVRAMVIVLLAALLAGPMLVLRQERIEPDSLIVLVDRSASLQLRDMMAADGSTISRDDALRAALQRDAEIFGPEHLGSEHRRIVWLGFDSTTYEVEGPGIQRDGQGAEAAVLPPAEGEATLIRTAIEQALQREAGRPISGIVLFSDGRSTQATGADLVRRLNQHGVGVFAVPLGAEEMALDLAISAVEAPDRAFVDDMVPVNVWIDVQPRDAAVAPSQVRVRLMDADTDELLDERVAESLDEPVRLLPQGRSPGRVNWRVQVAHEPEDGSQPLTELITENNEELLSLELVDRAIRVLYVEGYPRWEYRYLKNMLLREDSIASSMLLLSADRAFAQEGDIPITRMPRDAAELEPFDVIIVGDVPSGYFGSELMTLLRDHVAVRGAGLLWIGGPGSMPRTYEATPWTDLLPMRLPGNVDRLPAALGALALEPTALARAYNVMRLRGVDSDEALWPVELPWLQWVQNLGPLKPTAEVLAIALDGIARDSASSQEGYPLIVRMPYGAGLSLYLGTDETWRWRYGRGELYFEQFWVQLVRMLAANRLQQDVGAARLAISARRVERDRAVVVELVVRDAALLSEAQPRVTVEVTRADDSEGRVIERLELAQDFAASAQVSAAVDPMTISRGRMYRTVWQPTATGPLRLRVAEANLAHLELSDAVEVFHADEEKRQPLPDHERLATLAQQTGGQVIPLEELGRLAEAGVIPNRQIRTPNDIRESLWDSYVSLFAVLLLLTVEWVGRKMIRLV